MPATKKPRTPPTRTHTLHDVDGVPVLEIRTERPRSMSSDYYAVAPAPSDFGRAFVLRKMGDEPAVYSLCLEDDGTRHCDCRGWEAYGYCRHTTALAALVAAGKL